MYLSHYLFLIPATLTMVIVGTVYGWTTTSLLHLTSGTGGVPLTLTHDESSWIVSLTVLGSMFGSLVGAKLADLIGRKYCLLLCCAIFTLGWLNVYTAPSVLNLYLARVILGIGVGIAYTINPMYVSEIADINIRGALGTLIAVNVFTGSLLTCILGHWLTYHSLVVVLVIISSISFLLNTCFPETPYFLVAKRRKKQACQSITYYKGIVDSNEMKIALRALRPQTRCKLQPQAKSDLPPESRSNFPPQSRSDITKQTWFTKLRVILQRNNRKALFIMLGLIMAQQLGGNFITMQYLEVLFSKTTIGIDTNVATILVLAVGLISGTLSTLTVESLGRRKLLILSTLGSCFTLIILATYLLLDQHKIDVSIVSAIPVIDLIIYQVMFQIGLGTLPNVLLCELFPMELKGFVGAIIVIFDGIIGFTVSKLYQVITDSVGSSAIYFIFATSCSLAFVMVYIWVPETKGKTYHEIVALLAGENLNSLNEQVRTNEMAIRRI
ncbi:facilitated trehalose transporter Tret1-like [Bombus flavifrons]|uniref:facilitated trehalose transporter Tret1-like n=1 Tax=Bombus flavifrons TaxID=103934 RepID=UPI00370432A9